LTQLLGNALGRFENGMKIVVHKKLSAAELKLASMHLSLDKYLSYCARD